ncbi:hypothetical protein [Amycolatopsis sp. H20-H5]|uniref:hypothetical protein n=1 Tax=Amycolatopsis sp. H20-H5 TaxID=3046309 RepID=UPI002DB6CF5F|nr:hypothetical protein [Amycolatopsis sp. H20-H5]MEC3976223.1 hypothetical protein [Amycolatopsis sp. H20-H5]
MAAFLVLAGGALLLAGLVRFFVGKRQVARLQRWDDEGVSVRAISARLAEEETHVQLTAADTEVLPAVALDDLPTEVLPVVPSLPNRKRPYVRQRPTPWPRRPVAVRPEQELMQRILDGLHRLT